MMKPNFALQSNLNISQKITRFFDKTGEIILGKHHQVKLAFCALLAEGHILIEDVPGVGKTTLVKLLSKVLGLKSSRIQFTNDLLPSDIIGTSIYDESQKKFLFHPGPIFGQIVIADELNRATPKTQSACLQAMEERKVSVDGVTYSLPEPFFLVATQNPREQMGTYPLPESQLDRFLMRIELGFPDRRAENLLLKSEKRDVLIDELEPILSIDDLLKIQKEIQLVHTSDNLINYIQDILESSRAQSSRHYGLSPRAGLALLKSARAWAYLEGRGIVLPEDVQAVGVAVMGHRLNSADEMSFQSGLDFAKEILQTVPVDQRR